MTRDPERRFEALRSYARKQGADVEQARVVRARRREEFERAEQSLEEATHRIEALEADLREQAGPGRPVSLDSLRRGQAYLAVEHENLKPRVEEHQRSEKRLEEAGDWLLRCARNREATQRLGQRSRTAMEAEMRRRDYARSDEFWIMTRGHQR